MNALSRIHILTIAVILILAGADTANGQWTTNGNRLYTNYTKVGVNTSVPGSHLHINRTDPQPTLFLDAASLSPVFPFFGDLAYRTGNTFQVGEYDGTSTFIPRFKINAEGQVGIGNADPQCQLHVTQGTDAKLNSTNSGYLMVGNHAGKNISIDDNEIMAVNNLNTAPLFLQHEGGEIRINDNGANEDVALSVKNSGNVSIGDRDAVHMLIDNNEIMVRNWANQFFAPARSSILYLQADGGRVFIGTRTETVFDFSAKLSVAGKIRAEEVVVETGWADYVFEDEYELLPLSEVEAFIEKNGHLPAVPSATEVQENGLSLGEMDATLLRKIEELTLYMIELKKENEALKAKICEIDNH